MIFVDLLRSAVQGILRSLRSQLSQGYYTPDVQTQKNNGFICVYLKIRGRTSQAELFLTQATPTVILEECCVRVSARQARIARVKSKEGEARFPGEKQFETNPFDARLENILRAFFHRRLLFIFHRSYSIFIFSMFV